MTPPEITPQSTDEHFFEVVPEGSADSIEAFLASLEDKFEYPALAHLGQTDEEIATEILDDEGQETPDEEHEENGEITPPTPPVTSEVPPPVPPVTDHVTVNGQQVPLTDIQRLYEFDQFLRSNPEAAERVQAAVQPVVPAPTETTPPADQELTPPEWMDLEDPQQRFMWDSHVTNQKTLLALQQSNAQRQQAEINQRAQTDMTTALSRWTAAHPNFNEDQIEAVRKHGADMNIIGSVMATSSDPVTALVRVMDIAALDDPDLRTVYLAPEEKKTPTRQQHSATRKGKLNSLGGSSGSVPRTTTPTRPQSDREAIDQFALGLAESFQQN